jgi:hypothetical protein
MDGLIQCLALCVAGIMWGKGEGGYRDALIHRKAKKITHCQKHGPVNVLNESSTRLSFDNEDQDSGNEPVSL